MVQTPQKIRNCRRITGGDPTRAERNICVIIFCLSATKPVWHNQEINTFPRNCQVRHIECIWVLSDAPKEQPDPRVLRSSILTLTVITKGLKKARPNNQTSETYTCKYSPPHQQVNKYTSEHIHWPTGHRRIFFRKGSCKYSTTPKGENKRTRILQKGDTHFYKNAVNFPTTVGS